MGESLRRADSGSDIRWEESADVYKPEPISLSGFGAALRGKSDELRTSCSRVFIERGAMERMLEHARKDCTVELGGVLVGAAYRDRDNGDVYVVITKAIPADATKSTSGHLQFTHESWGGIFRELPAQGNELVLGWYHTHPGLGVFMSGTDRRTQSAFFAQPWQVAAVIDPVANEMGLFYGKDAKSVEEAVVYDVHRLCLVESAGGTHKAGFEANRRKQDQPTASDDRRLAIRTPRPLVWLVCCVLAATAVNTVLLLALAFR